MTQTPSIGRIVHYMLGENDAAVINKRRDDFDKARYTDKRPEVEETGFQAHLGNRAEAGQVFPAIIVRVFGGAAANLKVLLDGSDDFWATSRSEGEGPFRWTWPQREETVSEDLPHYHAENGLYEPESHSAAKNIVLIDLEELDPHYAAAADHIEMADRIVESLIKAGVTIPDEIADPCKIK